MIDGDNEVQGANLTNWLKWKLGVDSSCDLTDVLPPSDNDKHFPGKNENGVRKDSNSSVGFIFSVLLVIDHFNGAATNSYLGGFMEHLATSSVRTKRLVVLIVVSDFDAYNNMLTMNGGQKIQGVYADPADLPFWDRNMIATLFDEEVAKRNTELRFFIPLKKQIVDVAAQVVWKK